MNSAGGFNSSSDTYPVSCLVKHSLQFIDFRHCLVFNMDSTSSALLTSMSRSEQLHWTMGGDPAFEGLLGVSLACPHADGEF